MAMDDYYELLDVAPDSDREDIRVAFRDKRDALQAGEDGGAKNRAKVAELNRAWNVLSDPHQRERYDERLADSRESGDDDGDGEYDDDDEDDARPVPVTRAQKREELRRRRGAPLPVVELPDGLTMAPVRPRLQALAFDLLILLMLALAIYFGGLKVIDGKYPGERSKATDLLSQEKKANKVISNDKKLVSAAKDAGAAAVLKKDTDAKAKADAAEKSAEAAQARDQTKKDQIAKNLDVVNKRLAPWLELTYLAEAIVLLLYLVPGTAIRGQTLGKRIWKVRVVKRLDGSLPGFSTALLRFGPAVLIGLFLAGPFGLQLFGFAIPVLGMIGWISKPNRQGLHDRLAKTVVVDA
jgi:hypothetical protein